MIRVDVAYALIYNEDREEILMVNNKGSSWSLPGGAVEKGETLEQAVIRETKEETGLTIEVGNIVAVNEAFFKEMGHHTLFITFKAKIIKGEISIQDKDEITEIKWVDLKSANELMPYHATGIEELHKYSSIYTFQG
ncbi:DNA mismatch repair protein MutT [Paenibacillus sp. PK3_47]|uniref:NUDIX hydrolase n=1 Tax=Paenibacillus sp. PK3_47 TaxID=2072642 RepID=UPI00201E1EB9|nr:NUDIX hydrolase [Paenibacillus sp. PK3_47]UQZ32778.1 DNA mismatch repair protein MutT [Paenibacillus sp. PK3_47]